jgi:hypothetical protein
MGEEIVSHMRKLGLVMEGMLLLTLVKCLGLCAFGILSSPLNL